MTHTPHRRKHSELRRGLVRISSNYARQLATVALGLILMRLQFQGLGAKAFGLVGLLGSTVGIASMIQQIVRACVVRELAEAFHSGDDLLFRRTLNSALFLAAAAAVISLSVFALLFLLVPQLNIDPHLQSAARIFILCKAAESLVVVLSTPIRNIELVRENMLAMNLWQVADKAAYTAGAAIVFLLLAVSDPAQGVILFGLVGSSLFILVELARALELLIRDHRLIPHPSAVHFPTVKALLKVSAWNVAVLLAHNLHHRADALLINLFLGSRALFVNAAWTLAINLGSQVRMLSRGMTDGIDAVAARLSLTQPDSSLQHFLRHATRLQAFAAVPGSVLVAFLAQPILLLILGKRIDDPAVVPLAVTFIRITAVGLAARAIAENWTRILYGAGHITRYAPVMLAGGILNPLIAIPLFLLLPDRFAPLGAPIAFTVSITLVQCLVLPIWAAPCVKLSAWNMIGPALPCTFLALLCSPVLLITTPSDVLTLFALAAAYGLLYLILCIAFALSPQERARFAKGIRRALSKGLPRTTPPPQPRQPLDTPTPDDPQLPATDT